MALPSVEFHGVQQGCLVPCRYAKTLRTRQEAPQVWTDCPSIRLAPLSSLGAIHLTGPTTRRRAYGSLGGRGSWSRGRRLR